MKKMVLSFFTAVHLFWEQIPANDALGVRYIFFKEWWTNSKVKADANGQCRIRAFYGKYTVTCGMEKKEVLLSKDKEQATVSFEQHQLELVLVPYCHSRESGNPLFPHSGILAKRKFMMLIEILSIQAHLFTIGISIKAVPLVAISSRRSWRIDNCPYPEREI